MKEPREMKREDLKKAWERRWKNAKRHHPNPSEKQMNPRWERVERATTFLRSGSTSEESPA